MDSMLQTCHGQPASTEPREALLPTTPPLPAAADAPTLFPAAPASAHTNSRAAASPGRRRGTSPIPPTILPAPGATALPPSARPETAGTPTEIPHRHTTCANET